MVKFASNPSFILLVCIYQISFTIAKPSDNRQSHRRNNNDLQKCLSSSLPLSIRTVYPCETLTNVNNSQYSCINFNVTKLSALSGARISHSPAVIVYAKYSSDVQNVVKCATKLNYIVNALSGGHSYEGYGLGSAYNNIIINMEAMNYININQQDRTVTLGAGARLGPLYYRTYQHNNYTVSGGSCAWIGVAGHALGGGQGFLVRLHGLLSDNILEMKAVSAQGELLTINEIYEPELYWALRGGGGGLFVIVTEFKIRLFKAPSLVTSFSSTWDSSFTKLVMQRYQSLFFSKKRLILSNNIYFSMSVTKVQVDISIFYYGFELEEFNKVTALLLTNLPTPKKVAVRKQDWLSFVYKNSGILDPTGDNRQLLLENLKYPTYYFKAKHLYFDQPISDSSLDQLIDKLASIDGQVSMLFNPWDGYLSTIPVEETAFPHRHFRFGIQFMISWNDQQNQTEQLDWLHQVYSTVYDDSTKHSYINYIDREVPNWMDYYYSTHLQRLINIKRIYDENNRFYFERTIE